MTLRSSLGSATFVLTERMGHSRWLDIIERYINEGIFRIAVDTLRLDDHHRYTALVKAIQDDWRTSIINIRKAAEVPKADTCGFNEDDEEALFVSEGEDAALETVTGQSMLNDVVDMIRTMVSQYKTKHPQEFEAPKTSRFHCWTLTAAFVEAVYEVQNDSNGILRTSLLGTGVRKASVENPQETKRKAPTYSDAQKLIDHAKRADSKTSHLETEAQAKQKTIDNLRAELESTRSQLAEYQQKFEGAVDVASQAVSCHAEANSVARKLEQNIILAEQRLASEEKARAYAEHRASEAERRAASAEETAVYYERLETRARRFTKEWIGRYFALVAFNSAASKDTHDGQEGNE